MQQINYSLKNLDDHLNKNVNEIWGSKLDSKITPINRHITESKETLKLHYQKFIKLHTLSEHNHTFIQTSKAFQNLKPEYQEILRGDLLDQLLRGLKIGGLQINPNEIEEQKLRELWRFQDVGQLSESSISPLAIHQDISDWVNKQIMMMDSMNDQGERRNHLFQFNQCIKSNKYLLNTSTKEIYDLYKSTSLVNLHLNSPVLQGNVIFSPLLQGESLVKILSTEVQPFTMTMVQDWFNSENNNIIQSKKYWKLRAAYKNINILVMSEYVQEYMESYGIVCPPPPDRQIIETIDQNIQTQQSSSTYNRICENTSQIMNKMQPFLKWANIIQKDSDYSGSLLMHTIDQVFLQQYQQLNQVFFKFVNKKSNINNIKQTNTSQIESFIKLNLDGLQNTTSDEIPFICFINDILNSAGGELWTQSDLSSDFALNYDKEWKTLQNKVLEVAKDSQCNQWIKVLYFKDEKEIEQKLSLDSKIYGNKVQKLLEQPITNLYMQYYERYLKMLLLKTKSLCLRILSYANVFRHMQWQLNNIYKQISSKQYQQKDKSSRDPTKPQLIDYKEFTPIPVYSLTNPMLSSNLQFQCGANQVEDEELKQKHFLLSNGFRLLYSDATKTYTLINDHKGREFHYDSTFSDFLDLMSLIEKQAILILDVQVQNSYDYLKNHLNPDSRKRLDQTRSVTDQTLFSDTYDREYAIWQVTEWQTDFLWYKARICDLCFRLLRDSTHIKDALKTKFIEQLVSFMKKQLQFDACQPYNFNICAEYQLKTLKDLFELIQMLTNHKGETGSAQIVKIIIEVWCYLDSVFQDTSLNSIIQMKIQGQTIKQIWSQYNRQNLIKNDNISKFSIQLQMQGRIMEKLKTVGVQLVYGTSETSLSFLSELDQLLFLQNDPIIDNFNSFEQIQKSLQLKLQEDISKSENVGCEEQQFILQALKEGNIKVLLFNFGIDKDTIIKYPQSDKFNLRSLIDLIVVRKKLYKELIQGVMISNILITQIKHLFMNKPQYKIYIILRFDTFIEQLINKGIVQTNMMTNETLKSVLQKYETMFYQSLMDLGQVKLSPFLMQLRDWVQVALSRKHINQAYKTLECVKIINTSVQSQAQTNIILLQEIFQQYLNDNAQQIRTHGIKWERGLLYFKGIDVLVAQCLFDKIEVGQQSKDQFRLIELMSKHTTTKIKQAIIVTAKSPNKENYMANLTSAIKARKQHIHNLFRSLVMKVIDKYELNSKQKAQPRILTVIEQYLKMNANLLHYNGDESNSQAYLLYEFGRRLRYQFHHLQFKIRAIGLLSQLKKLVYSIPSLNYQFKEGSMKIHFQKDLDQKHRASQGIIFEEILDFSDQIRSLVILPKMAQIISLQHFNYDDFAPKRHINKSKIADGMTNDIKERMMKVEEVDFQEQEKSPIKRIYNDDWNKMQQIKMDRKICLLTSQITQDQKSNKKRASLAQIETQEAITQIESRWIQLYRSRKEFKNYTMLESLTRLPVFKMMKVYDSMCKIIQLLLSFSMLNSQYEEDITFQLALLANNEMYVAFQTCSLHFAQAAIYKNEVSNSSLLVKTVLEKQFSNQNQHFQFLIKKQFLESGYIDYGLRCKDELQKISQSVQDLEGTLSYIKNNPKVSDENEALTTYLKKKERNLLDQFVLNMYSTFNKSRQCTQDLPQQIHGQNQLKQIIMKCGLGGIKHLSKDVKNDLCIRKDFNQLQEHKADWTRKLQEIDLTNQKDGSQLSKLGQLLLDTNNSSQSSFMEILFNIFLYEKSTTLSTLDTKMNPVQQIMFSKMGNLYQQQSCLTHSVESHTFLLPFLVNITKSQREKINERSIRVQSKLDNRQRQELLDVHLTSAEIFFVEKVKHQILKLKIRMRLICEINFSLEYQVFPLACDAGSNYLFKEFKKRLSIIYTNNNVPLKQLKPQIKKTDTNFFKFDENITLKTLLMKMIIVTLDLDRILIHESVKYYQHHLVKLTVSSSQQTTMQENLDLISIVSSYNHKLCLDSCQIMTINKGPAFVISCVDYQNNLKSLTFDLFAQKDKYFSSKLYKLEQDNLSLKEQLSMAQGQCDTLKKENEFFRINMWNIVDARVSQKTTELLFQLDQYKKMTQEFHKDEYARSIQQKLDIHDEYTQQLGEQTFQQTILQQKHSDYKRGLNTELEGFIQVLLQSKTREIKGLLTNNLDGEVSLHILEKFHKLEQTGERVKNDSTRELTDEVVVVNKKSLKSVQAIYSMFKQMRVFYVLKGNKMKEQFTRQFEIQESKVLNTANYLIQIKELQEETTLLRQQKIDLNRTISILEYQNLKLQRSLQDQDKNKLLYQQQQAQQQVQLKELKIEIKDMKNRKSINANNVSNVHTQFRSEQVFDLQRPMTANYSVQSLLFSDNVKTSMVPGSSESQQNIVIKRKEFAQHQQLQVLVSEQVHSRDQSTSKHQKYLKKTPTSIKQIVTTQTEQTPILNSVIVDMQKKSRNKFQQKQVQITQDTIQNQTKPQSSVEKYITSKTIRNIVAYKNHNPKNY